MRLFYRAKQAKRTGEVVYEQAGSTEFCCADMCRHWLDLIGFGAKDCQRSTSRDVNLYGARLRESGRTVAVLTPVLFCPWCGQEIETCRVK